MHCQNEKIRCINETLLTNNGNPRQAEGYFDNEKCSLRQSKCIKKETKEKSLFFFLRFPLQAAEASESVSSSIFIVEENKTKKEGKITRNEQNILRIKIQKRKEMG